jgi:glycosyltransferase involved in cell wall biosynthesis
MRIVTLCDWFYPEASGKEFATFLHIRALANEGFKFTVITNTSSNNYTKDVLDHAIEIHKFPQIKYPELTDLFYLKKYNKLMEQADKFYVVGKFDLLPLIKTRFKKPIITHLHDYSPFCAYGIAYNRAYHYPCYSKSVRKCYRCISHKPFILRIPKLLSRHGYKYFVEHFSNVILFPSQASRNLAIKLDPHITHKSFVVYNHLPSTSYIPIYGDDIGFFGGLSVVKGAYFLIKAWMRIFNKYPAKLHMSRSLKLPSYMRKLNIIPYGNLHGYTYDEVYKKVKAVVVPSLCPDTAPYVPTEACLRGRIVIASKIGGIPEYVGDLPGVKLVPPNDVDALTDALEWAFSLNRSEAIELGLKNRAEILRRFDARRITRLLIKIFEIE